MINVINRALMAKKKVVSIFSMLLMFTATSYAEVVWNGDAHDVGSWNAKQFAVSDYAVLATASEGDVIAITVTAVDNTDNKQGRITLQSYHYQGMGEYDEYNVIVGTYYFALTEQAVDSLKTTGFNVTGENFTFNKVELLYKKALWSGILSDNNGWAQSSELDESIFASFAEGDMIGVKVSAINNGAEWHQFAVRGRVESDTEWKNLETLFEASVSQVKTYFTSITAEQATSYKNKKISLAAQYLDITEMNTYLEAKPNPGPGTAIDNTNANVNAGIKVIHGGTLYIQRGDVLYNMQGQIVK